MTFRLKLSKFYIKRKLNCFFSHLFYGGVEVKRILTLLVVLVLALSLVACGGEKKEEEKKDDTNKEEMKDEKKEDESKEEMKNDESKDEMKEETSMEMPKIGVTIYKFDDNFMSFVRRSIEISAEGKAEIMLEGSQNDQGKQNEQVDIMIQKGVKALAINLVSPQSASAIIEKAKSADLPVIFFNKEPSPEDMKSYEKAWYVGTTSSESGVIQGEVIAEQWKAHPEWDKNKDGVMQYVLLKGEPGHPDAEARTKYSVETIEAKGIKVEELAQQAANWDSHKGKEFMDAWIAKHQNNIEVVIANNDGMALGAIESLAAAGFYEGDKTIGVFGVDAIPDALQKIKDGQMHGTVLNDAKNQGQATVDLAINVANGKDPLEGTDWKMDDNKAVRVPYIGITMENIDFAEDSYK